MLSSQLHPPAVKFPPTETRTVWKGPCDLNDPALRDYAQIPADNCEGKASERRLKQVTVPKDPLCLQ